MLYSTVVFTVCIHLSAVNLKKTTSQFCIWLIVHVNDHVGCWRPSGKNSFICGFLICLPLCTTDLFTKPRVGQLILRKRQHCLHKTRVIAIQEVHLPTAFMRSRRTVIKLKFVFCFSQSSYYSASWGFKEVMLWLWRGDCRLARE